MLGHEKLQNQNDRFDEQGKLKKFIENFLRILAQQKLNYFQINIKSLEICSKTMKKQRSLQTE